MLRYESEFQTMIVIEQRLLNARSELVAAERRLGGRGQLSADIQALVQELDDALTLTRRAKLIMAHEWRKAEAAQAAA